MITFNVILERFEQFADAHYFIKTFSHGTPADVDLDKFTDYPLMHVVYTGSSYTAGSKIYSCEVFVMGAGPTSEGKFEVASNTVSDSEQCLEDILADLRAGWNIFDETVNLQSANISPLMHEDHNTLVGAALIISMEVPYDHSACFAPLDGVGIGSNTTEYQRRGILMIKEVDGDPTVSSVRTIIVPNDSLTDDGGGQVTLDFATGGFGTKFRLFEYTPAINFYRESPGFLLGETNYGLNGSSYLIDSNRWTVTGDLPVSFVIEPLNRFISILNLSSNNLLRITTEVSYYQEGSPSLPDPIFNFLRVRKSGSTAYLDVEVFKSYTPAGYNYAPVGLPFAETITHVFDIEVDTHPNIELWFLFGCFYGTVRQDVLSVKYEILET